MGKVTIQEIAKAANVSPATVSRVMNNSPLVREDTVKLVRSVMENLGYQPNELARSLRSSNTKTIGVIVSDILNPFYTSVVRGIEDGANASRYNIMLCNTDQKPEKEAQYLNALIAKQVDGIIIASSYGISNYDEVIGTRPVVFIDRRPMPQMSMKYDMVLVQNQQGARLAVRHLLDRGYRRIGFIAGQNIYTTSHERLQGYKAALKEAGCRVESELVRNGDFLGHSGYRLALDLIQKSQCDSVFAANNMILMGVLRAMNELGLRAPDDIGLLTFDDLEWMRYSTPSISAIAQPTYDIGATAIQLLLDRIYGSQKPPQEVVLEVQLLPRESTARA